MNDRTIYVLNAGNDRSIAGFRAADHRLVPIQGSVRSLGPGNPPSPSFLMSPAQVAMTPDAGHVLVTTKTGGTVVVWGLDRAGRPSATPRVTTIGAVPSAMDFDRAGRLLLVNAARTPSSHGVNDDGTLTLITPPRPVNSSTNPPWTPSPEEEWSTPSRRYPGTGTSQPSSGTDHTPQRPPRSPVPWALHTWASTSPPADQHIPPAAGMPPGSTQLGSSRTAAARPATGGSGP